MPYTIGTASDYLNLQQRLRGYLTGGLSIENEVANVANTGDGFNKDLLSTGSAVAETWTLTCTTGGATAVFSVTGSVSGAQAAATVGTPYSNTFITFELVGGPTDFIIGDELTFDVVANDIPVGQQWTELDWIPGLPGATPAESDPDTGSGAVYANELYLRGPGLAGTDEIHVNMYTYYNTSGDYYNFGWKGAGGYASGNDFDNQPGVSPAIGIALWQFDIQYWIVADGRRFIISCRVDNKYMHAYCGLLLPYGTPTEYPYPLYMGGAHDATSYTADTESEWHRAFFEPSFAYIYTIEGTWLSVRNKYENSGNETVLTNTNIWPYSDNVISTTRESPGSVYPVIPLVLHTDQNGGNVYGELSGAYWCPGFANASENNIVIGGTDYIVFQNVYRTGNQDYYALKLE